MIVTDLRYGALAIPMQRLRDPSFGRGVKDCVRRRIAYDQHYFPVVAGGRVRFSRRRLDDDTQLIVAEWPAQREVA